jgi:hypothetical protein
MEITHKNISLHYIIINPELVLKLLCRMKDLKGSRSFIRSCFAEIHLCAKL